MSKKLGVCDVKPKGENKFLIRGAKGELSDDGCVTISPAGGKSESWTTDPPTPPSKYDVFGIFEDTFEKFKWTIPCTAEPSEQNGWTASFTKIG